MSYFNQKSIIRETPLSEFVVLLTLIASFFLSPRASADLPYRISESSELVDPQKDLFVRVKGAKVAYLNETALKRDFPFLRDFTRPKLEAWVLDQFAFVGREQLKLNGVRQEPIPLAGRPSQFSRKWAYRPEGYGRAAVLQAFDSRTQSPSGLVDIKGTGHPRYKGPGDWDKSSVVQQLTNYFQALDQPETEKTLNDLRVRDHSDGLMSLGEAIAELTRQEAAQRLFDIHNARFNTSLETVESYFIIALPFGILKDHNTTIPAALYARQAHSGRSGGYPVPPELYTDRLGGLQSDGLGAAAVDMGGVQIEDPLLTNSFGVIPGGDPKNPQNSKAWAYGHQVAEAFTRKENPDLGAVDRHLEEMLAPIEKKWQEARLKLNLRNRGKPTLKLSLGSFVTQALSSPDPRIRSFAASTIPRIPESMREKLIEHALVDTFPDVRSYAVQLIFSLPEAKREALIEKALSDISAGVRNSAVLAIPSIPESRREALVVRALADAYSTVQYSAIRTIPSLPEANREALILKALGDAAAGVRIHAVQTIPSLPDSKREAPILRALGDAEADVRSSAVQAILCLPESKREALIVGALGDSYHAVRQSAVQAIPSLPESKREALVMRALGDADTYVRYYAVKAIPSLPQSKREFLIKMAMSDTLDLVRDEAREIKNIKYKKMAKGCLRRIEILKRRFRMRNSVDR